MPSATNRKRRGLLDVNVLVALFDVDHIHHDLAHDWFADNRAQGWATCPITENGFLRVFANPKYGATLSVLPPLVDRLRAFRASGNHEFWEDSVSMTDTRVFAPASIRGHRQLTDVYLLGLAHAKGGRLVTFDRSIPLSAVPAAEAEALEVIGGVDDD